MQYFLPNLKSMS